jgi:hypothetical protein
VLLVIYTDWCPHCHNYSRIFHDPRLVELARRFVMVRVERDENPEIGELYDVDGEYVPRTFFLRSDGTLRRELRGSHPRFRYYLDEHAADELLSLMRVALEAPSR